MTKEAYIKDVLLLERLPVFYQPWYLDIFDLQWDVETWSNQADTWLFPYFKETKSIFNMNRAPFATPYYGPICIKGSGKKKMPEEAARAFGKFAKQFSLNSWSPIHYCNCDALAGEGFSPKKRVTHILPLAPEEGVLFDNMDYMRRKNVRKAEKELFIKEDVFDIDTYLSWIAITYKRRKKKSHADRALLEKYVCAVRDHKAAFANSIFNAEGTLLSMSLVLYDGNTAYSILGANNPEVKHSAATTALLWRSITDAKKAGCRYYDFEGSSIPEIAKFFSKFGGERIEYQGWEQVNSLLWKLKTSLLG